MKTNFWKKWFDPLATAWNGVVSHKLRSFLTMLGIVIGVGAVITLMSVGRGTTANILSNIESMGANLMTIRGGASFSAGGVRGMTGGSNTLTQEDADAIAEINNVTAVSPSSSSNLQLIYGSANTQAQVTGTTPSYTDVNNVKIANGTFFTQEQYNRASKVIVIGSSVAETLFGDAASAVGQKIRAGTMIVTVIGVVETNDNSRFGSQDVAYIPLSLLQQSVSVTRNTKGEKVVSTISLTVASQETADQVEADVTSLLRTRHGLAATAEDDFSIQSMSDIISTLSSTTGTMTLLLGAIAGISLLVGGIGVMNIMLVSVLERTREIGVRKALGAKERDIWSQFLIEAALLTLAGGIVGIAGGWSVSWLLNKLDVVTTLVSSDIIILAVSVSVGIGLFFGFYPAWNASRLNPIQALRSE